MSQSVFIKFGTSLPLNFVFYLIYSGSIDDTSAAALLKGDRFRFGAWRNMRPLGAHPAADVSIGSPRTGSFRMRGIPKGARPLCVVAEEGVTGEKPHRKGFSLRAPFCLLFRRGKSRPGCGGGTPISHRMAWYLFVRKRCFSPTRPATGESALHRPDALAQKYQKLTSPLCQTEWSPAPRSPRPPACRPRTPRAGRQSPAPGTGP